MIYRLKYCEYNNNDEDNSPKTLNDKHKQASSQKFRQIKEYLKPRRLQIMTREHMANYLES